MILDLFGLSAAVVCASASASASVNASVHVDGVNGAVHDVDDVNNITDLFDHVLSQEIVDSNNNIYHQYIVGQDKPLSNYLELIDQKTDEKLYLKTDFSGLRKSTKF